MEGSSKTVGKRELRSHETRLVDDNLVLRPMTESDWEVIRPWNQDPEVLHFSEGAVVTHRELAEVQAIYRGVSHTPADMFVFEVGGVAMGDGWVQQVNLARIIDAFPGQDCYVPWRKVAQGPDARVPWAWDVVCRREYFEGRAPVHGHPGPDRVRAGDEPYGAMVVVFRRRPRLQLLILHRAAEGPDYQGDWAWTPPAGARFPAEPPDECARRELHEEIGLEASLVRMFGVGGHAWLIYCCEDVGETDIVLDEEHDRYEWVDPDEAVRRCQPQVVSTDLSAAVAALSRGGAQGSPSGC